MIGAKPKTLASAIAALDFTDGNAELERLRDEVANVTAKQNETREEAQRLADAVRDFAGPEPDAVAAAILAGKPLAEATKGATSRDQLEAQRDALFGALEPLRQRAEDLRSEIADVEARERSRAFDAMSDLVSEIVRRQTAAAQELVATYAGLAAIADATGRPYMPELGAGKAAARSVLGGDGILGWQSELAVPAEVREALNTLAEKSRAVRSSPATISTRYL